jgi:hypothetical protein
VLGFRFEIESHGPEPGTRLVQHLDDRCVRTRADHAVDLGHERAQFLAETLREAAGDDQLLTRLLLRRVLQDRIGRLGFGRIDEGAGVDDHGIRVRRLGHELPAGLAELADHHLGIDEILSTTERNEGDALI